MIFIFYHSLELLIIIIYRYVVTPDTNFDKNENENFFNVNWGVLKNRTTVMVTRPIAGVWLSLLWFFYT